TSGSCRVYSTGLAGRPPDGDAPVDPAADGAGAQACDQHDNGLGIMFETSHENGGDKAEAEDGAAQDRPAPCGLLDDMHQGGADAGEDQERDSEQQEGKGAEGDSLEEVKRFFQADGLTGEKAVKTPQEHN